MMNKAVIYRIINPNNSVYIGQSINWYNRKYFYKSGVFKYPYRSAISNSIIKHGYDSHNISIIHELPHDISKEVLDAYECFYIQQYKDCGFKMLNLRGGGSRGRHNDATVKRIGETKIGNKYRLGRNHSQETKNKMKVSQQKRLFGKPHFNIGSKRSDECKLKMSQSQKRVGISKERREKMVKGIRSSSKMRGRIISEDTKKKISLSLMGRYKGVNSPSYGIKRSDETKRKISNSKRGVPQLRGELNHNFGRKHSETTILKMRESQKNRRGR